MGAHLRAHGSGAVASDPPPTLLPYGNRWCLHLSLGGGDSEAIVGASIVTSVTPMSMLAGLLTEGIRG